MRGKLVLLLPVVVALVAAVATTGGAESARGQAQADQSVATAKRLVRIWTIHYRSHDGQPRKAYVSLPSWYGKGNNPRIPFVISPHGRGVGALANAKLWGALPARGTFAVISPEGAGRKLARYSWGSFDQIEDLARMPEITRRTLPWLRIDRSRIYAFGGSMGGQETLLLLARYPKLLAGAAAFDSVADFARQYRSFPAIPCDKGCRKTWHGPVGKSLQSLARQETGGTPRTRPGAYAVRSPAVYARSIATSCVPLQLWWSLSDRIVVNQRQQSGALYRKILRLNPKAPVQAYVGYWVHSHEMKATTRLPLARAAFGLLQTQPRKLAGGMVVVPRPWSAPGCGGASGSWPGAPNGQVSAAAR